MYQLPYAPPKMPFNDCIVLYKQTGDEQYLSWFLHCYEPTLNRRTAQFCKKYQQEHNFEDIKQAIVETLALKLPDYNPELGVDFLKFTKPYVTDAVHDYIRQCGGVFFARPNEYKTLRKVAAIYYNNSEKPLSARVQAVAEQTGLSDKKIHNYIHMAEQFRFPISTDTSVEIDDEDATSGTGKVIDTYPSPDNIVLRSAFYEAVVDAIEKLRYRDSKLLLDYMGIDCPYCGRVREPTAKADIADGHQLRDEQSVDNRFRSVCDELRAELRQYGWL